MFTANNNLYVKNVQLGLTKFPVVSRRELVKDTMDLMNKYHLGIACIVDEKNRLLGVFTDGDIRRAILSNQKPLSAFFVDDALDYARKDFKYVNEDTSLIEAVNLMGKFKIWDLPVISSDNILKGLLHLHPALDLLLKS